MNKHTQKILSYTKNLKVLFVEDDRFFMEETALLFKEYFKEVHIAYDGEEGLKKYLNLCNDNSNYIDLIITDINMPNKNGIEMIKEVYKHNEMQEILVLSAHNETSNLMKLIELGISDFLIKPIQMSQFQKSILKISKNIHNKKSKRDFLIIQSKQAAMGEMIDIIGHQWLSQISIMKLRTDYIKYELDEKCLKYMEKYIEKQKNSYVDLEQTIKEFRRFFNNSQNIQSKSIKKLISQTLILVHDLSKKHNLEISYDVDENIRVDVISNEIKHLFLNLIQNSIQAFEDNKIKNRQVNFEVKLQDEKVILIYCDNAGGISKEIINKIFESKVTSKSYGSGMGLYLCNMILKKINAKIKAYNVENKACFEIEFKRKC